MLKRKVNEADSSFVHRLVKAAFTKAVEGHTEYAQKLWNEAIQLGYEPKAKNVKGFEIALHEGSTKDAR